MSFNSLLLEGPPLALSAGECEALGFPRELGRGSAGDLLVRLAGLSRASEETLERVALGCGAAARLSGGPHARVAAIRLPAGAEESFLRSLMRRTPPLPALAVELRAALRSLRRPPGTLLLPGRRIRLGRRTLVQGILNVTPDSFYDGGRWSDPGLAVEKALGMAEEGADLVDIGAESTRPGARAVPAREEIRRILPVLEALRGRLSIPISVDTTKPDVAAAALEAGAELINDVSGLSFHPGLASVAARHGAGLLLSHIQGRPRTMQKAPRYHHLFPEVLGFLRRSIGRALAAGVRPGSILVDPGIGFGKTARHNRLLLKHLRVLRSLGYPVMVGLSRKSFLAAPRRDRGPGDRLEASLGAGAVAVWNGASMLRVHDVAATVRMARSVEALRDAGTAAIEE